MILPHRINESIYTVPLEKLSVLVLDIQTSGSSPKRGAEILEVAWQHISPIAELSANKSISRRTVKPKYTVPRKILRMTGLNELELKQGISRSQLIADFKELLGQCKVDIIVSHYGRFEWSFLSVLMKRKFPPVPLVCTFEIARRMYASLPSKSIRAVSGHFGHIADEMKCASNHVKANRIIWQGIKSNLSSKGIIDFGDLLRFIQEKPVRRGKNETKITREFRLSLPSCPGIYKMVSLDNKILYIGKASSLKARVNSYFTKQKGLTAKIRELLTCVHSIKITESETALEAALLESDEIKKLEPPYNYSLKNSGRRITYFSRDFLEKSSEFTEKTPLGPFVSTSRLDDLISLVTYDECLEKIRYSFFGLDDEDLLRRGIRSFEESFHVELAKFNLRQIIALGLVMLRRDKTPEESELEVTDGKQETEETMDPDDDLEEWQWSVEEVGSALLKLVKRSAKSYLKARMIRKFSNCKVCWKARFNANYAWRIIEFRGGEIVRRVSSVQSNLDDETMKVSVNGLTEPEIERDSNINTVETYDRIRVLISELDRVRKDRREVVVELR